MCLVGAMVASAGREFHCKNYEEKICALRPARGLLGMSKDIGTLSVGSFLHCRGHPLTCDRRHPTMPVMRASLDVPCCMQRLPPWMLSTTLFQARSQLVVNGVHGVRMDLAAPVPSNTATSWTTPRGTARYSGPAVPVLGK